MPRLPFVPFLAIACLSVSAISASPLPPDEARQLVIVSFDGAHDNRLWEKSRKMADNTGARFTYFLSCTFLMTREQGKTYRGPGQRSGRSNVGFAQTPAEIRERLDHIWAARAERHEIASHGCGHFDGGRWSKQQWKNEFASFSTILESAWSNTGNGEDEPEGWRDFVQNGIAGFRAPYLSTNEDMFSALKETGFRYDASGVSRGPAPPSERSGLATFELPLIPEGPGNRRVIAMDYNLFVRHSGGLENASQSQAFEERAYRAFRRAFDQQHKHARQPLQIGMHFVEMNGGAYWRALERLLSDVCGLSDVDCVTYGEAIERSNRRPGGGGA